MIEINENSFSRNGLKIGNATINCFYEIRLSNKRESNSVTRIAESYRFTDLKGSAGDSLEKTIIPLDFTPIGPFINVDDREKNDKNSSLVSS